MTLIKNANNKSCLVLCVLACFFVSCEKGERVGPKKIRSRDNLRQIVVAVDNHFRRVQNTNSLTITNNLGEQLLSWRVAILPDLGYEDLYKQFNLEKPWDSPENKKLLTRKPDVYFWGAVEEGETG